MSVRKIASMQFDGIDYRDPCVEQVGEWLGLQVGDKLPSGIIIGFCIHPESECAWAVIQAKDSMYEVDLPWEV